MGSLEEPRDIFLNLADNSFIHAITGKDPTTSANEVDTDPNTFITTARYSDSYFYGIVIDTGASKYSTAGHKQFLALKKISNAYLDTTKAGPIKVQFGIGSSTSLGTTILNTPIGNIQFYIVDADTPFLLSLLDMDRLGAYYDNLQNLLVTPKGKFPVFRRFGHAFLLWGKFLKFSISSSFNTNPCFLNEIEIRRLHRRFGHPSAQRLYSVLKQSGHNDVSRKYIDYLTKFCDHCQNTKVHQLDLNSISKIPTYNSIIQYL